MADEYDPAFPTEESESQEQLQEDDVSPKSVDIMPLPVVMAEAGQNADTASVADRTRTRSMTAVGLSGGAESDSYKPETGDPAADSNTKLGVDPTPILEKEMEEFEKLMLFETAASKEGGGVVPCPKDDGVLSEDAAAATAATAAQNKLEWNQGLLPCMPPESESAAKEDSEKLPAIPMGASPGEDGRFHSLLDMEPPKRRSERTKRKQLMQDADDEVSLEAKPTITIPVVGSKTKAENVLTSSRTSKMPENLMLPRSLSVSSTHSDKPTKDSKQLHSVPSARCFSVDKESSIGKDSSKDKDGLVPGIRTNGIKDDSPSSHPVADVRTSVEKISVVAPPKKKPVVEWMVGFVRKDAQPKASSGGDLWNYDIDVARLKEIIPEMLPQNVLAQYLMDTDIVRQNQGQEPKASSTIGPRSKTLTQDGSVPNDSSTVVESGTGMPARPEDCKHGNSQGLEIAPDVRQSETIHEVPQASALKSVEVKTQRDADQTVQSVVRNDSVEGTEIKPASDSEQHPLPSTSSTELISPESPQLNTKTLDKASHLQDLAKVIPSGSLTESLPLETTDARMDASSSTSPTGESLKSLDERKMADALSEDSASLDAPEFQVSVDISSSHHQDLTDTAKERVFKPIQALADEPCTDASGATECRSVSPKTEVAKPRRRSWRGNKGKGGIDESIAEAVPTRRSTRLRSIEMRRQSDSPKECAESTGSSGRKRRLSSRNSNGSPLEDPTEPEPLKRSASVDAVKASQEASSLGETLRLTSSETVYQEPNQEDSTSVPMDTGTKCLEEAAKNATLLSEVTPQVGATLEKETSTPPQVSVPTVIPSNGTAAVAHPLETLNSVATSSNHDIFGDVGQVLTVTNEVPEDATGIQNDSSALTNLPTQITSVAKVSDTTPLVEASPVEACTSSPASPQDEAASSACGMMVSKACMSNPTSPVAEVPSMEPVTSELKTVQPLGDATRVSPFLPACDILSPEVTSESSPPIATTHVLTSSSPTIPVPAEEESSQPTHVNPGDARPETSIQLNDLSASATAQPMEVDIKENHEANFEIPSGTVADVQTDTVPVNCNDRLTEAVAEGSEQTDRRDEKQSRHIFTQDPVAMECTTAQGNLNTNKTSRVKRPSRFSPMEPTESPQSNIRGVPIQPLIHHPSTVLGFKPSFFSRAEEFAQDVWEENFTDPNRTIIRHVKDVKETAEQPVIKQEPEDSAPSTETQKLPEADIPTTTQDVKAKAELAEDGEVIDKKLPETVGAPEGNRNKWGIVTGDQVPNYENIPENYYLSERKKSKAGKEARRMVCDCTTSKSERSRGMPACGEDCLNRLLLIECTSRCPCGDYCTNRRFSKRQYADVGVFYAENKGHGLKAKADLKPHEFVMEYCGEVLNFSEFKSRVKKYNKDSQRHFYFMALRADEIIDATMKGNMSRFINHSCDPNCETQKWTVNGQLRVGFFTKKSIPAGSELTFDYQFEQYGENAQKCLCGSANCRGFIGKQKRARAATGSTPKRKESVDRKRKESFEDASLDDEIEQLCSELDGQGLRSNDETLTLARHMVLAETTPLRLQLLKILEDTTDETCLKHFLTHHGLKLLWSWMVDIGDKPESELKMEILNTLVKLPIPHKNALEDSKIFSMVERWSKVKHVAKGQETEVEDSSASETPSRCATPVSITTASRNTPAELAKVTEALTAETDSERSPGQVVALALKTDSAGTSPLRCDKPETAGQDTELKTEVDSSTPNVEGEEATSSQSPVESSAVADSSSVTQSEIVSQSNDAVDTKASEESAIVQPAGIQSPDESKTLEEVASVPHPDSAVNSEAKPESDTNAGTLPPVAAESLSLAATDSETVTETKDTSLALPANADSLEDGELPSEAKQEDREKMEVCPKQDVSSDSDATDAGGKVEKTSGIALMAGKLLETWSSLKEIYRIPKNRDRERDRDYSERDRDRDRDRDRGHDRDRRYGRDRDRDRDYDRDRDRDRDRYRDRDGRRERSRERDRHRDRDRDRDNKKRGWDRRDDRKRRSRSTSREKEEKQSAQPSEKKDADAASKGTLPKLRKPWKNEAKSEGGPQGKQAKANQSGLSKEERRQQFAKQVEQADMEEELRKQQEEEFLAQHPHFVDEEGNVIFVDANGFPIPPPFERDPNQPMMPMMHPEHPGMPMEHGMPPEGPFPHHMNPGYHHDMMPPPQGMVPLDENGMPLPMHGHPMYEDVQQPDMGMPPDAHMHHPHGPNGPSMPPHVMSDGMPMMQEHDPQGWEAAPSQSHPPHPHPQPVLPQPQFRVPAPPGPGPNHIPVVPTASRPPSFVVPQQGQSQMQPAQPQVIQPQVVQAQPQPAAPAQTVTFVTPDGMLVTQTIMPLNTESTVQTNIQQAQQIQQHLNQGISTTQGIPSPPSKPKTQQLPPNWRTARDQEGKVYYYHAITRQTQWDAPSWDGNAPVLGGPEADMDLGTPTYDEKLKKRTTTAAADTSSELAKRCKLQFRSKMSHYVISCLNTYRKPDCKVGRITNTEDFKHLARKLTHGIMDKELKHCKNFEDLEVNSNVKHKAKEYIRKYMTHVGPVYHKDD